VRHLIGFAIALTTLACGDDEPLVAHRQRDAGSPEQHTGFDVTQGRALAELRDPATRRALCTLLGLGVSGQAGQAGALVCEGFVSICEQGYQPPSADAAAPVTVSDDLSGLFGCPITAKELDACLADLLSIGRKGFADVTCSSTTPSTLPPDALLGAIGCTGLIFKCPDLFLPLVQSLAGQPQQGSLR
jgi:hypothetical protein